MNSAPFGACALALLAVPSFAGAVDSPTGLQVGGGGRNFVQKGPEGDRPFFWMADTAWSLYKRDPQEMEQYIATRAAQGFNVLQGPTLEWNMPGAMDDFGNTTDPLAYDVSKGYSELRIDEWLAPKIDTIINLAASHGMYVALTPMWSDSMHSREAAWGTDRAIADIRNIGRQLGERYKDKWNVVWIAGGESVGERNSIETAIALGEGIQAGAGPNALIGLHPTSDMSSGEKVHQQTWLDFNILQTGHTPNRPTHEIITNDWNRNPAKPTVEGEVTYEGIDHDGDYVPDIVGIDVRRNAYWSVFAGGAGFTYGHADVAFFRSPQDNDGSGYDDWLDGLTAEAGTQMVHLRKLMESRPMLGRVPDQKLIQGGENNGDSHIRATRDGSTYLMAYLGDGGNISVKTDSLAGDLIDAYWYNPRTGEAVLIADDAANNGRFSASAPGEGDWVLVVDDAAAGYDRPGVGFTIPEPASALASLIFASFALGRGLGRRRA